jgi:hypothetical protein
MYAWRGKKWGLKTIALPHKKHNFGGIKTLIVPHGVQLGQSNLQPERFSQANI